MYTSDAYVLHILVLSDILLSIFIHYLHCSLIIVLYDIHPKNTGPQKAINAFGNINAEPCNISLLRN